MIDQKHTLHPEACKHFDDRVSKLTELLISKDPPQQQNLPTDPDIHIAATLTEKDIVGDLTIGSVDRYGNSIERWVCRDGKMVGLEDAAFKTYQTLSCDIQARKEFVDRVSKQFIEDRVFTWLVDGHRNAEGTFSEFLQREVNNAQSENEFWIPIAHLRIARPIQIGQVTFKRISKPMIENLERSLQPYENERSKEAIESFVGRLHRTIQGYTAGAVTIAAELQRGRERAFELVETALNMLRFFEAASLDPFLTSYVLPLGQEAKGSRTSFVFVDGVPTQWEEGQVAKVSMTSGYPAPLIDEIAPDINAVSHILLKEPKTKYELKILEAVTIYSRVSISPRIGDKLVYALVALETIFLKSRQEPIQRILVSESRSL